MLSKWKRRSLSFSILSLSLSHFGDGISLGVREPCSFYTLAPRNLSIWRDFHSNNGMWWRSILGPCLQNSTKMVGNGNGFHFSCSFDWFRWKKLCFLVKNATWVDGPYGMASAHTTRCHRWMTCDSFAPAPLNILSAMLVSVDARLRCLCPGVWKCSYSNCFSSILSSVCFVCVFGSRSSSKHTTHNFKSI